MPRLTSFDRLAGDLVDNNNTLDHKKAIKNTTKENRNELRSVSHPPMSVTCLTDCCQMVELCALGHIIIMASASEYIYINVHSESVGRENEMKGERVRNETRDTHLVGGALRWTSVRLMRTTRIWCERLAVGVLRSGGICGELVSIEAASTVESPVLFLGQT